MKKLILAVGILFSAHFVQAQTEVPKETWYHADYHATGVYGVNTQKALDFLKSKNRKPQTLVVGVLDSGVEHFHEDLKDNMWVNPKEIAGNGKDDDKNGYIDDIHGWSFLGNEFGVNYNDDTLEVTRLYKKYQALFDTPNAEVNLANQKKFSQEFQAYESIKKEYNAKLGKDKYNLAIAQAKYTNLEPGFTKLINTFGDTKLSETIMKNYKTDDMQVLQTLWVFNEMTVKDWEGKTMKEVADRYLGVAKAQVERYQSSVNAHYNINLDPRAELKVDNYEDNTQRIYGNNDSNGPESSHGTHVAGIIAAVRGNGKGTEGTAGGNHVKIMSVRMVPNGDERDKDVANAIRYAVDNGAKILNMSFGKSYSPDKKLVWDAFKYASDKNVLIVKAAGNSNEDIDTHIHYPTNFNEQGAVSKSVLTVGASTRVSENLKARFSNYGIKSVDVFGPGAEIYAPYPGVTEYRFLNGTSMASPAVAGVAALVWSHYPKLTAQDIRTILMETVNKNDQLKDISVSGGVVDSYNAVQRAEEIYKQRRLK
ncbi:MULTISPECIES: S8 family serine peptidase [Weeksella]|uniref:S8 family serine peptidase n=1 Tax=Weeksella TaxID=1013 RepID=UPI0008A3914F|nr:MULTISPECIES: S8 family serine peptidase [Weeksella]MDK7374715.1 S8 family serine peptidase [Weeksella virosa]OFM85394.1 peptidase S8 [Weeksella sp. HMSC059D05]SUP55117.1 Cell wall-associated protease precursor [Weeksella virosa]